MNPTALRHAQERVGRAQRAIVRLKAATRVSQIQEAWSEFLLSSSGVFSKLEEGSKQSGKSGAWFGRIKHLRRTDPLLRYVHHARNSDEHGIEEITEHTKTEWRVRTAYPEKLGFFEGLTLDPGGAVEGFQAFDESGQPIEALEESYSDLVVLVDVFDQRFNDLFPVPRSHRGRPISDPSPVVVAELTLSYLHQVLSEAEKLG